jgi:hypothetical protein
VGGNRMSPQRALIVVFAVVGGLFAASSAGAAEVKATSDVPKECISDASKKALNECPGGPSKFDVHQKRGVWRLVSATRARPVCKPALEPS